MWHAEVALRCWVPTPRCGSWASRFRSRLNWRVVSILRIEFRLQLVKRYDIQVAIRAASNRSDTIRANVMELTVATKTSRSSSWLLGNTRFVNASGNLRSPETQQIRTAQRFSLYLGALRSQELLW